MHQQARVTGHVAHPNVVSVLDLGEDHGAPYAVMELLEGATLTADARLASLDRRLDVMRQVCDGLLAAHEYGVVHGALKPSHVFIRANGTVKLLDFGADDREGPYKAPELKAGQRATERSDVYSAGATFGLMLSDDTPDALRRSVTKALQADPRQRHAGVAELRAEIDRVRESRENDRLRVVSAAVDRYRDIEALVAQHRTIGRQLGLPSIEHESDARLARLATSFPEFARAGLVGVDELDSVRAADALARLQRFHNDVAVELSVLRAATGGRR